MEGVNNYFNIKPGGNIGIGTIDPGQTLSIAGTLGIIEGGVGPSFYTIFQGANQGGNITYTLPSVLPGVGLTGLYVTDAY
jgi:hypothetical protein